MTIIQTRLGNLELLAAGYRFGKEFCDAAGISPSYLSQLRAGTKTLGNTLTRQIEQRLSLADGSLDVPGKTAASLHAPSGLQAETMSAAFALQGMDPLVRTPLIRLILAIAASNVGRTDSGLATPFEEQHASGFADIRKSDSPSTKGLRSK